MLFSTLPELAQSALKNILLQETRDHIPVFNSTENTVIHDEA